jgi:hypothetical protein
MGHFVSVETVSVSSRLQSPEAENRYQRASTIYENSHRLARPLPFPRAMVWYGRCETIKKKNHSIYSHGGMTWTDEHGC